MKTRGLATLPILIALLSLAAARTRELEEPPLPLDAAEPRDALVIEARSKVAADPASAEARVVLGNRYFERGWAEEALAQYEEATRLEREYAVAWNNAGIVEEMLGRRGAAMGSFRRAVGIDEHNAEAHFNLGRLHEREHAFDRAVEHFSAALRLQPRLGDPLHNPLARSSKLLSIAKLAVYRSTSSASLPPLGPAGESGLLRLLGEPKPPGSGPEPDHEEAPDGDDPSEPGPAAVPTPAPTPIVLGPSSIPASSASSGNRPPGDSPARGTQAGRGIRRGGPGAPTPPSPRPPAAPDEQ